MSAWMHHALMATLPWQPSFIHADEWLRGRSNPQPNRKSTEIRKKIYLKRRRPPKMLPVKVLTRKRLIGSYTWCPAGVGEGRGSQSWRETGINERSAGSCLLSTSLTASLARHGGQAPGRKHDKNTRMIKASCSLNVYNALLKSARRLSTYREAYYARSNADGTRSGHSRAGTRNGTNAPLLLCSGTKQEK